MLTERLRLQFRAEGFNIFNHPTFALPQTLITNPTFGRVSSTQVRRGKYNWA